MICCSDCKNFSCTELMSSLEEFLYHYIICNYKIQSVVFLPWCSPAEVADIPLLLSVVWITRLVDCRPGYWSHIWALDIWSQTCAHARTHTLTHLNWLTVTRIISHYYWSKPATVQPHTHTHTQRSPSILSGYNSLLFTVRLSVLPSLSFPLSPSFGIRSVWWLDRSPRRPAARRLPVTPFLVGSRPAWNEASCLSSTPSNRRNLFPRYLSSHGETLPAPRHSY